MISKYCYENSLPIIIVNKTIASKYLLNRNEGKRENLIDSKMTKFISLKRKILISDQLFGSPTSNDELIEILQI